MTAQQFSVGDRIIAVDCAKGINKLNGYYGKVMDVSDNEDARIAGCAVVYAQLLGRTGDTEPAAGVDEYYVGRQNPFPFLDREIEHAD